MAALLAGAVGLVGMATAAGAGVFSFVMVPIFPPEQVAEVIDVYGPNRHGDFVMVGKAKGKEMSFLWRDETWTRVPIDSSTSVRAAGVTDDLLIYGTYRTSGDFYEGFVWDAARTNARVESMPFQPASASAQDDIVGNRAGVGAVAVLPGLGDVVLPPLSGDGPTFATAVNDRVSNFGGPGGGTPPYVVGRADASGGVGHAVLWIDGEQVFSLSEGEFYPTGVDDDSHVSGYELVDGLPSPVVWIRQSGTSSPEWVRFDLPTPKPAAAVDINSQGEMVGGKSLWVVDTEIIRVPLNTTTYIPQYIPREDGDFTYIEMADFDLVGIADSGRMMGTMKLTDGTIIPMQVVPYDRNNNATPDYREVDLAAAVQDPLAGFLPPDMKHTRIGLHAPSKWLARYSSQYDPANTINEVHVVRFLTNHNRTHILLNDPASCEEFTSLIGTWTGYERQNGQSGAEIVYTERSNFKSEWHPRNSKDLDYVPPRDRPVHAADELVQRQVLQNTKVFGKKYARFVDYFQLGNESFTNAGVYYFEDLAYEENGEWKFFTGTMKRVPGAALPYADAALRTWWQKRVDALLIGSALAGRPLQVIGSALPTQAIFAGLDGDSYDFANMDPNGSAQAGSNRSAFAVRAAIEWCNDFGAHTDLHMHFYNYENHFVRIVDALENAPGVTGWPRPQQIACLEYGPSASRRWWYRAGGGRETAKFYDNDPLTLPDGVSTWDEWLDFWWQTDADLKLHDTFLADGMDVMQNLGYTLICYSDTLQTSAGIDEAAPYDMSAIFPSKLDPEFQPARSTRWKRIYEDAAGPRALQDWAPRPYTVPDFCDGL